MGTSVLDTWNVWWVSGGVKLFKKPPWNFYNQVSWCVASFCDAKISKKAKEVQNWGKLGYLDSNSFWVMKAMKSTRSTWIWCMFFSNPNDIQNLEDSTLKWWKVGHLVPSPSPAKSQHCLCFCLSRKIGNLSRWWFQTFFFIFTPTWGDDPIWLIFFKWVETTN